MLVSKIYYLYKIIPALSRGFANARRNSLLRGAQVKDIVEKDSNDNGIADWEESLWGLDPTKNGPENKELILAKKQALNGTGDGTTTDEADLTANDKMARELLATITSLEDSGNLTPDSIANISKVFGDKITVIPLADIYSKGMLTTVSPDASSLQKYYSDFEKLYNAYQGKDIGSELTFISQGIQNNDQKALDVAQGVADSYRSFGKDLMGIKVPTSLVEIHLSIANNYEKVAVSIGKMSSSLTDQTAGMNGVISYKKYSDDLLANIDNLQTFLEKNGILKSS